jgi:hypothetical protein
MATKYTDEQRDQMIEEVGQLAEKTGLSARELSKIYKNGLLSHVTISNYLKIYKKRHLNSNIDFITNNYRGNIKDLKIQQRVLKSAELCLKGYTIDQISVELKITYRVAYDDLHIRLEKINKDIYDKVKEQLQKNKNNNLKNNKGL